MLEIQVSIETLQLSTICLNSTWMGDHLRTPGGTGKGVQIPMLLRGEPTVSVLQIQLQSKNMLSLLNQVNKRILTWRFSCGNGFCVVWDFSFSTQGFAKKTYFRSKTSRSIWTRGGTSPIFRALVELELPKSSLSWARALDLSSSNSWQFAQGV